VPDLFRLLLDETFKDHPENIEFKLKEARIRIAELEAHNKILREEDWLMKEQLAHKEKLLKNLPPPATINQVQPKNSKDPQAPV